MKIITQSIITLVLALGLTACQESKPSQDLDAKDVVVGVTQTLPPLAYTLGQWSFNREMKSGKMNSHDFLVKAKEMGFDGVDFVSQFFDDKVQDIKFFDSLASKARDVGIAPSVLLVDLGGKLGASDHETRKAAIDRHKLWVDATKRLGCPAMRINAHGDGTADEVMEACYTSISSLADYAKSQGVTILIENHGAISNNGDWLKELVLRLQSRGVYALADFDNWCYKRENGEMYGSPCTNRFDAYEGMRMMLPIAQGTSVKTFVFDDRGYDTKINYDKMFAIIRDSGYSGPLGIEYEGHDLPSAEGIAKNLKLAKLMVNKYLKQDMKK